MPKRRDDAVADEAQARRYCREYLVTCIGPSKGLRVSIREIGNAISNLYYDGVRSFEKQLRLIVRGERRPKSIMAWQIGQTLMHLGVPGWNGLAMLYLAGRYRDFIGISSCYALSILGDNKKTLDDFTEWITALPMLMIPNDITTDAGNGKHATSYEYYPHDRKRLYCELEYPLTLSDIAPKLYDVEDFTSLEQARIDWLNCDVSSRLSVKASLIATSRGTNENRAHEAVSFVRGLLRNPGDLPGLLDKRMSNWA